MQEDRLTGTRTVTKIRYARTDTMGKTLADSAIANAGTMEFSQASDEGSDVFHPVIFQGACAGSELVGYFKGFGAGEPATGGGWARYWDADPAGERLMLWGIAPSTSFHRVVNFDGDGKKRTMWYALPEGQNRSVREFYYFEKEKG